MAFMGAGAIACEVIFGGAAAAAWSAVYRGAQVFGRTLRRTGDSGAIALTFDDGPNPAATPALLRLLERHSVRATFFLTGVHVRAFPALAREIAERGHVIGNHTETHPNLAFLPPQKLREELNRCREAIESATGVTPKWVRPPFGFRGPQLNRVVKELGYTAVVMWSRWAWDWKPQPPENVIRRLKRARGGEMLLLHDGDYRTLEGDRRHTVAALEYWLPRWKNAGLKFATTNDIHAATADRSETTDTEMEKAN